MRRVALASAALAFCLPAQWVGGASAAMACLTAATGRRLGASARLGVAIVASATRLDSTLSQRSSRTRWRKSWRMQRAHRGDAWQAGLMTQLYVPWAVECTELSASPSSQESLRRLPWCTCVSASARQSRAQCRAREFCCKILSMTSAFGACPAWRRPQPRKEFQ